MVNSTPLDRNARRIRGMLLAKGLRLTDVAARFGLRYSALKGALRDPHEAGERAIAEALGISAAKLWPERYDKKGVRLARQPLGNFWPRAKFRRAA